ncbi:MAG: D-ribose pyranase [Anaerolineales bacterium]|nr:D-ribose pyranase [Anaerolineales bacterium]
MKKQGILNGPVSAVVANLGHFDMITVADAGLPIPDGPQRIDLMVRPNLPQFIDVVAMVLEEMTVQEIVVAAEMLERSPQVMAALAELLPGVPVRTLPHSQFKAETAASKAVIRTGEYTPYANVILVAGVNF